MTREAFRELVKKGPVLLDGATGTNLQKAGMPVGVCPEQWILENSEVLIDLQKRYVEAGTDILFAPTFTASRIKLKEYGLEDHLEEMNRKLVALSKEAAKGTNALVAGDLTMTGEQLYPLGDLMFEDLVDVYKEQAKIIAEAGADLFVVETMMSLQECRAAVLAIREVCDLPVMVSLTYNEDGRTLYGTDPVTAVVVMQSLGADAVGMNCSTGPEAMLEPIAKMAEYATIPLLAKPNAGMPELIDGQTVFNVEPEEFAEVGKKLVEEGAAIIGGCCGTTPEHIRALKEAVKGIPVKAPLQTKRRMLTSERKSVEITLDGRFMVIGERINPTGKKKLQAELKEGSLNLVRTMALEQEENGASILDINMGMNGIDEKEMMLRTIYEVTSTVDCPLCIDSSHVDIIEAALRIYPGRALINSISLEKEKFEKLLPIAKKYGAMFILLPLSDEGLPKDSAEKHGIIRTIMDEAVRIGMAKEDIIVDGLVATIGANPNAALECFETFSYCKNELELPTACGLSNISFGLPERTYVNTAFLTMAIANGLTMAIANPSQELLMNAAFASDMLLNKKESDIRYIERMNFLSEKYAGMDRVMVQKTPAGTSAAGGEIRKESTGSGVFQAVLKGNKEHVLEEVKKMLDGGAKPDEIINEHLIAAINEVGELFDKKKYFLPQLISSANTMKLAIEYLEPMLERSNTEAMATIVVATVEGDIHDIGKNLVVLMLKNYGYHVIDLGKDVPADVIVDTAMNEGAKVIGLSALMTTTMMRMKDVVELAKEKGCTAKIVIGGAAITESFSDEIGADGYSKDAAECVKLVERLLA
ncbi:5-methyltetrahydrofolate--homocysteine methyltransferase [Roseburia intestinalis]|jgi:5-methyltetrahydrofolate--homocysteine methyltransferase|uniref:Methionine synthase n=1 Tax=Roseburia intestinalis TaxID=166486 RepID=A0A413SQ59_9FIRM|nr:homocysteine S-methyltransferase family protein [Roseburia intestinalis]RHA70212.1 5-methyltetrahydrofolate--homocysteine methyltransferase [Roseburia intestinalis]